MSEVIQDAQHEFWQPPSPAMAGDLVAARESIPTMAEVCPGCGTEFLLGSGFCHSCGGRRPQVGGMVEQVDSAPFSGVWSALVVNSRSVVSSSREKWNQFEFPSWLHYLHFHEIKNWIGLSTASLIAFMIGIGCIAGALLVGLLTARNFVDWEAIQFYRGEWLLAAVVSFVAGILLKKPE